MNSKKINLILIISILIFGILAVQLVPAMAQAPETKTATQEVKEGLGATAQQAGITSDGQTEFTAADLGAMAGRLINYVFGVIGIVFVTVILIGAYFWMAAAGQEENIKKAKTFLLNGIFGLMVIFVAWTLVALILYALNTAITAS